MNQVMRDRLSGIFFIALGIFLWYAIPIYVPQIDELTKMGPRFFPKIISVMLIILSIMLIVGTFNKKNQNDNQKVEFIWSEEVKVILLLAITIFYVIILEPIGYKIATPLVSVAIMTVFKVRKWYNYLIIFSFIGLVYFIFQKLMYVQLP